MYRRVETFKHDSWAATALYESSGLRKVCKFNRQQSLYGFPMRWIGRLLARHEMKVLRRLEGVPNVPPPLASDVFVGADCWPNALARHYVPGHPLGDHERVGEDFFLTLEKLVREIHQRGIAYVDMHKRENIIVGEDRQPYLVDFQISMLLSDRWPWNSLPFRAVLEILQRCDAYHWQKHYARCRPDLLGFDSHEIARRRPWWIRAHRLVAKPFRTVRRKILVILGIRSGRGMASSEHFPEDVFRHEAVAKADPSKREVDNTAE